MSLGELSPDRRPRRQSPRAAGRRAGAAGRQGVAAVAGSRSARLRGGGGPTAAAAPQPHKERRPGPRPYGPEGPWWPGRDPGGVEKGKRHFLPGPPPRTAPRGLRSRRLKGFEPQPTRIPAPAAVLTCALGIGAASSSSLLSWVEAPSASKSSGLVRPWPRLSSVGPGRQSPSVAPPSLQAALPVGPQYPSFLGSAPLPGTLPLPLGPAPSLALPVSLLQLFLCLSDHPGLPYPLPPSVC